MSSRKRPTLEDLDSDDKLLTEFAAADFTPTPKKPKDPKKPEPQALVGGMGQYPATRAK